MGVILNLDENINFIEKETFVQDIRDVHAKYWVIFSFSEDFLFNIDSCFVRFGIAWQVISCKKTDRGSGMGFVYSILGYPSMISSYIVNNYSNMSSLASSSNIEFDSRANQDFKFEFPLRNIPLGALLFKYRYSSFEVNISNLCQAWFIHYDHRGLVSNTYSGLGRAEAFPLDTSALMVEGGTFNYIHDIPNTFYNINHRPSVLKYKNLISLLFGVKFDVRSPVPAALGCRYIFTGIYENMFSNFDKLLLIKQKKDSVNNSLPWTLTFGQLLEV